MRDRYPHCIETTQFHWENQYAGFYIIGILVINGLSHFLLILFFILTF